MNGFPQKFFPRHLRKVTTVLAILDWKSSKSSLPTQYELGEKALRIDLLAKLDQKAIRSHRDRQNKTLFGQFRIGIKPDLMITSIQASQRLVLRDAILNKSDFAKADVLGHQRQLFFRIKV